MDSSCFDIHADEREVSVFRPLLQENWVSFFVFTQQIVWFSYNKNLFSLP